MAVVRGGPRGVFDLAVAGVLGNVIVSGLRHAVPPMKRRQLAVRGVAGGIRAGRWIGQATEETWLRLSDLIAEGRAQVEEMPGDTDVKGSSPPAEP